MSIENKNVVKIIDTLNSVTYRKMQQVAHNGNLQPHEFRLVKEGRGLTIRFAVPTKNSKFVRETFKSAYCCCESTKWYFIGKRHFKLDYDVFVINFL